MTETVAWKFMDRLGVTLAVVIFAILALEGLRYMLTDNRVPAVFQEVVALNSPMLEGQNLNVRIVREKLRADCPVISTRTAIDEHGKPWDIQNRAWEGGPEDVAFLDYTYPTAHLRAGIYTLFVDLVYTCPERSYAIQQPPVTFKVISPL